MNDSKNDIALDPCFLRMAQKYPRLVSYLIEFVAVLDKPGFKMEPIDLVGFVRLCSTSPSIVPLLLGMIDCTTDDEHHDPSEEPEIDPQTSE